MTREPTADERMGMTWWNGLDQAERSRVIAAAEKELRRNASAADAWALWKAGRVRMDGRVGEGVQDRAD